jgi:hypothetical protein
MKGRAMHQLTINLPQDLYAFVEKIAERETRPVSLQIRHFVAEAARRAGSGNGAALEPWPAPLPVVTPENIGEVEARLAGWVEERDSLAKRECKTGMGSLMPHEQNRLAWLRDTVKSLQSHVAIFEGIVQPEPRRPAPPDLRGRP